MAAIAGSYIHSALTVDAQVGLNADPTGMLINSCSIAVKREKTVHRNFTNHQVAFILSGPACTISLDISTLARSTGYANAHPGTKISRATLAMMREGVNHGIDITEGWGIYGDVSHTQPRGDLDGQSFEIEWCCFPVTGTGTLVNSN